MRFPALARTLRIIAKEGREGFYAGEVAEDIVAELNALGGLHTLEDFAAQRASYVTPISVAYRGVELWELPPSNQGIVALMVLKMLERLGLPPPTPSPPSATTCSWRPPASPSPCATLSSPTRTWPTCR